MNTEHRVLELALLGLHTERARIEQEIADISARLGRRPQQSHSLGRPAQMRTLKAAPNKGKTMSAAQKRAISKTMRELWAKRRRAAAKAA